MAQLPEGKRFYGAITVSDRGQIVIPADARRDFDIKAGDKLLILGDLERGLGIIKASVLFERKPGLSTIFNFDSSDPNGEEN